MDKKGMGVEDVTRILGVLIMFIAILGVIYVLWRPTEAVAEEKLPAKEVLQNLIKKFTTSPGEADIETQRIQADKIAIAIQKTINNMEDDVDCIEQIDFSGIDKDFEIDFYVENSKSNLKIYKIINGEEGLIFNEKLSEIISFIKFNPDEFGQGVGEPLDIFDEFKIVDKLRKIDFGTGKKDIKLVLYKDKWGFISFLADDAYLANYLHLDEKEICSKK